MVVTIRSAPHGLLSCCPSFFLVLRGGYLLEHPVIAGGATGIYEKNRIWFRANEGRSAARAVGSHVVFGVHSIRRHLQLLLMCYFRYLFWSLRWHRQLALAAAYPTAGRKPNALVFLPRAVGEELTRGG